MADIFISYRREDSGTFVGRIWDHLVNAFGKEQVFLDKSGILGSENWRDRIEQTLRTCKVILVIIGPKWLEDSGVRRIDDPDDVLRWEIETGLQLDKIVTAVTVLGAKVPRCEDLPESIRDLTKRQAFKVDDDESFGFWMDRLINGIEKYVFLTSNVLDFSKWIASFYNSTDLTGAPITQTGITDLNIDWASSPNKIGGLSITGVSPHHFSARFESTIEVSRTGKHEFSAEARDGIRVYINGALVYDRFVVTSGSKEHRFLVSLEKGTCNLTIEYFNSAGNALLKVKSP